MGKHLITFNEKDERAAFCDDCLASIGNMKGKLVMALLMFCLETYDPLSKENIREIIFCIENRIGTGISQINRPRAPMMVRRNGTASDRIEAKLAKKKTPPNNRNDAATGMKRQGTEQTGEALKPESKNHWQKALTVKRLQLIKRFSGRWMKDGIEGGNYHDKKHSGRRRKVRHKGSLAGSGRITKESAVPYKGQHGT